MYRNCLTKTLFLSAAILVGFNRPVYAMHIMEGFLPLKWAVGWGVLSFAFVAFGVHSINKLLKEKPELKLLMGVAGAFVFVLSALKLPSVTGSSSHPTGTGLGALLLGPSAMTVLGYIVLLFQAILLAHGGLTTLGANTFAMAVVGPWTAFFAFKIARRMGLSNPIAIFLAAALSDLLTYVTTSLQLALAFPGENGIAASLAKFLGIFAVTQIPIAVCEGLITVIVFNFLAVYGKQELSRVNLFRTRGGDVDEHVP